MTAARYRVYRALRDLTADGWPASVREVSAAVGLAPATVHHHLKRLEAEGRAAVSKRSHCGWRTA